MRRAAAALAFAVLLASYVNAAPEVYLYHRNSGGKIALTFDDGPHGKYTAQILDILRDEGVRATFFVVGQNVEAYPELLERELAEGHEIGNHTQTHAYLTKIGCPGATAEIVRAERVIMELTDVRPKLLRPPGGLLNRDLCETIAELDCEIVLWNIDTRDWAHNPVDLIVENVVGNTKSGDIILCHDFIGGESPTPAALRAFIPALKRKGFTFVTVSELLGSN